MWCVFSIFSVHVFVFVSVRCCGFRVDSRSFRPARFERIFCSCYLCNLEQNKLENIQTAQTSANGQNFIGGVVFHGKKTFGTPLLAAAAANKFHGGLTLILLQGHRVWHHCTEHI